MRRIGLIIFALSLAFSALPASAGKLVDALPEQMAGYAKQAGHILASIPLCGGDAEELDYFRGLARDTLRQIGADDDDIGYLDYYMEASAKTAKPRKRDCRDEDGLDLAAALFSFKNEMERQLKAKASAN